MRLVNASLLFGTAVAFGLMGTPRCASAAPTEPEPAPVTSEDDGDPAFRYVSPAPPQWGRAVLEEAAILALGYGEYWVDKRNTEDWDLAFEWGSFQKKLLLESASFDENRFHTNWLTHPGAGFLYYSAARGNRLGILPSFLLATTSSALWEYAGELQEELSYNDLIVTPVSGVPIGESALQLGAFFHRSRRTPMTTALGWLFAPFKSMHDAIDDLEPSPAGRVDDLGLDAETWHRFRLGGAAGITTQKGGVTQSDFRFAADTRLVNLTGYGSPGQHTTWFGAGEVSALALRLTGAKDGLVDLGFESHVLPAGHYTQDVVRTESGGLKGNGFLAGLHVAAEYALHDYDRDRRRSRDQVALVGLGATVENVIYAGAVVIRVRVDALANFAGVDAYALPNYRLVNGDSGLSAVVKKYDYYHAYGATLRPVLELEAGAFDARAEVRTDWFQAFDGLNHNGVGVGPSGGASDRRIDERVSIGVRAGRHLHLSLSAEFRERAGNFGSFRADRSEVGVYGGISSIF